MNILLAIVGSFYISYGFLSIKFLKMLTQGFVFGLIGGIAVTPGVGLFGLLLALISSFFVNWHLVKVPPFSFGSLIGLLLFGAVFGIVVGFIIGLKLDIAQRFDIPIKVAAWGRNILLVLGLSFLPESILDAKASYLLGLGVGALIGYVYYKIRIFPALLFGSISGLVLTLSFGLLLNDPRTAIIGFPIGLLLGATGGRPEVLAKQPKLLIRYSQNEIRIPISWTRFAHGFIIGFISGTLTFGIIFGFFAISTMAFAIALIYGLAGGVAIGLMLGSTYGFGPAIIIKIESLSERQMGQIGVFLIILALVGQTFPLVIG